MQGIGALSDTLRTGWFSFRLLFCKADIQPTLSWWGINQAFSLNKVYVQSCWLAKKSKMASFKYQAFREFFPPLALAFIVSPPRINHNSRYGSMVPSNSGDLVWNFCIFVSRLWCNRRAVALLLGFASHTIQYHQIFCGCLSICSSTFPLSPLPCQPNFTGPDLFTQNPLVVVDQIIYCTNQGNCEGEGK